MIVRAGVSLMTGLILILFVPAYQAQAQTKKISLMANFEPDWQKEWIERKLGVRDTRFEVTTENDTNRVLEVTSIESASALWHPLEIRPGRFGKISWRWKTENLLPDDIVERSKRGDDYVARVMVVFAPHLVSWKTDAICYVWATNEQVGSIYRSPYAQSLAIVVVDSGKKNKGAWVVQERDFVADYKKIFGENPKLVTAVAVMVDTDNTVKDAITFFDDLKIEYSEQTDETPRNPAMKIVN